MKNKPLVAIVGRPNVGKSTFFNRVVGRRVAIVEDTPGVTRDRIYADVEWGRHSFSLIDTGGIDPAGEDALYAKMKEQVDVAIDMADVIVFFVDGKHGSPSPDDEDVATLLRHTKKPVVLAVNKMDNPHSQEDAYNFYTLGMGDPFPISATLGIGIGDVLDEIVSHLPVQEPEEEEGEKPLEIAVIGKPNVGKSSLVNYMLGTTRVIVEDMPGTTRDAIDTPFTRDGQAYILIDTAGLRRKRAIGENSIERYGVVRALAAVRRADVVLLVIDATKGVTEQDTKIAGFAHEEGKACIVVVNKWDLVEKDTHTMNQFKKDIARELQFVSYAPTLFTSAVTGQRVDKIFQLIGHVYEQSTLRVSTGLLNEAINQATATVQPPTDKGRRLNIPYATQVAVQPPTFVLFVNDPELMHFSYKRYLENQLRHTFGFEGTPIRLYIRRREDKNA